jgi:serine/threonine protein kinase
VLIDADGIAKISDFGISKKNEYKAAYQRMTRCSMQGSVNWMAVEVVKGKGYSAKVDIWSLGCLVLEMLTGNPPWHGVQGSIIYLLGTGNAPPAPEWLSPLSKAFISKCFTIDPEMRPTATELLSDPWTLVDPYSYDFSKWINEKNNEDDLHSDSSDITTESLDITTE